MTDKQTNQQPDLRRNPPYEEEEINLIDLLRVIWKWKWLIIGGALVCAVIAAVISFQMPKIYEVSTIIEPAIATVQDNGNILYFDSVAAISGKIRGGIYNQKIKKALGLNLPKVGIDFKPAIVQGTNTIKVVSEWKEGETDLGVKVTQQLNSLLADEYAKSVELKQEFYDTQITVKQTEIDTITTEEQNIEAQIALMLGEIGKKRSEIKQRQESRENVRQRSEELVKEIERIKKNMEQMIQQRDSLLKDKSPEHNISLILYSTMIQQNMVHFDQLSNHVYDLRVKDKQIEDEIAALNKEIEVIKADIKKLTLKKPEIQDSIESLETSIKVLNLHKGLIRNIAVLASPEVSAHPVRPKKKEIITLVGFVSLLAFVFLAFFIEYLGTYRKNNTAG